MAIDATIDLHGSPGCFVVPLPLFPCAFSELIALGGIADLKKAAIEDVSSTVD